LSSEDINIREGAALVLGKMGPSAGDAVAALTRALDDENSGVREAAASSLGKMGEAAEGAVPSLRRTLSDDDIGVRNSSIRALKDIAIECESQQAVAALVDALGCESNAMRTGVINALADIGKGAVPSTVEALRSNNTDVRRAAGVALEKIGPEASDAVPELIVALKDSDSGVREAAAGALGKIGPGAKEAIPPLIESMSDEDSDVRDAALSALTSISADNKDNQEVLAAFVGALGDERGFVSSRALELVVDRGKAVVPALLEAMNSEDDNLHMNSIVAIGKIGPEARDAVPRLIKELRVGDDSLREAAAIALGEIGPDASEALPVLREIRVLDESPSVRQSAAEAIIKIEMR